MKDTGHLRLEPVVDALSFAQPHICLNESQSHSVGGFGKDNVPNIYFKKSPASFSVLMFRFCNLKVKMICRNSTFFLVRLK